MTVRLPDSTPSAGVVRHRSRCNRWTLHPTGDGQNLVLVRGTVRAWTLWFLASRWETLAVLVPLLVPVVAGVVVLAGWWTLAPAAALASLMVAAVAGVHVSERVIAGAHEDVRLVGASVLGPLAQPAHDLIAHHRHLRRGRLAEAIADRRPEPIRHQLRRAAITSSCPSCMLTVSPLLHHVKMKPVASQRVSSS